MNSREAGFTVLESVIASTFLVILMGAATVAVSGDKGAERAITGSVGGEMHALHAVEKIAAELRNASISGEDANGNGTLDAGEDLNFNGILDADWTLADGAKSARTMTFNTRIVQSHGDVQNYYGGGYSLPITYEVQNGDLVRVSHEMDPMTWEPKEVRTVLATDIDGVRFGRVGDVIEISVDVRLPEGVYRDATRTISTRIHLRG